MKKPVLISDLCDYRYLSELALNDDASKAVFVVSQGDMQKNSYVHNAYLYDFQNQSTLQLTSCNDVRGLTWDKNSLLFKADRDHEAQEAKKMGKKMTNYYRLSLHGGEANKAFSIPLNVISFKIVDENTLLVLAEDDLNELTLDGLKGDELQKALALQEEEKDYEVLDELPFWFNGRGFINKIRKRLYWYDKVSQKATLISPKMMDVQNYLLTKDNQKVVFSGADYDSVNSQLSRLMIYDSSSKQCKDLIKKDTLSVRSMALVDDILVYLATDYQIWGTSENPKFYKMNLNEEKSVCFLDADLSVGNSVGSDAKLYGGTTFTSCNGLIYMILTTENSSNLFSLDLEGKLMQLTFFEGSIDCFSIKEDKLVFIGMQDMLLQEVYEVKEKQKRKLTSINHILDEKEVLPLKKLSFINQDGVRIDGWVIEPRDYDSNKKYPAVLDIHGGPKTVYGETFFHEMQVWASMGYFVFFCNPRGSDGRGNAFMHLVDKYGTVDYNDLMEFKDHVLAKYPQIDASKVAVTGGSYGGFMTNWIIGHTSFFCCAASQRSIANWISKSLTTDIGYYHNMSQMAATPWTDIDKMWGYSPLKYANQCVTPTLFIQSDEDYRCWMTDAIQLFEALKLHGVDTRMCLFHKENHELSRSGKPKHRIRRLNEITNWFEKYCR